MHIETIPNRGRAPTILLRQSYREAGKTKKRTLANLTELSPEQIAQMRAVLRGERLLPATQSIEILRSLPHGHVLAALGTARRIDLEALLPRRGPRRKRALAMIIARQLEPAAKLATARMLDPATAAHSLGEVLELGRVRAKELYATLDWLGSEQAFIETTLARRHLKDGALLLYDVTSTYLQGRRCELAQYGYSRDHRGDRPQLVIGLLCAANGCPVAVEVFEGNTADPATLSAQIAKLRQRFNLQRVVIVGDRGLLTSARINQSLRPAGLNWITALWAPDIKALAAADGPLQLSLFDDRDLAEITSPDFPGERLVVCKNPLLAEERARARTELLEAAEKQLSRIQARVQRAKNPLRGAAEIGKAVGAVLSQHKMAKHFQIEISDTAFSFTRRADAIAAEARLDGIYVVRTNLPAEQCDAAATVRAYKSLAGVERAFRSMKAIELELRPVFHWTAPRVRAHVLPVAKAKPSAAARAKASRKRTEPPDGEPLPVHSFRTLLADLATLTRNLVRLGQQRVTAILAPPGCNVARSICSGCRFRYSQHAIRSCKQYQLLVLKCRVSSV
jgi:hypothetical protein